MLFAAHSGVRFLVLLFGVITILLAAYGLLGKRDYAPPMAKVAGAFAGLIDLQILLGLFLLFSQTFGSYIIGHLFMMIFAAVVAHGTAIVVKRRPLEQKSYGPHLVGAVLALLLIAGGIMAIPGRGVFQSTM
ncbi:MAG: hypothetical protein ACR2QM_04675 [Longimicrobiales bacterium]